MGQLSGQNADLRVNHFKTAKQVMRYLKNKMYLSIIYGAGTNEENQSLYGLVGYANNNYAGDPEDCKSVMGHCFFLNDGVVS